MVAKATLQKQVNGLMDRYLSGYQKKWGIAPQFNRYRQKWGFQDMIEDIGYEDAQRVVDYFFSLQRAEHGVQTLLNNYDRYARILAEREVDREKRHELRRLTEQRVRELEEHGNDRGGSS